ncbi:MAG TPA: translocation/assembly module TamB domain-containing protein [Kofleriaceae bacterium]|jgi:hypothetical protein
MRKQLRRALRWFLRGLLGALALVVLAIAFVLIALHTDWGRNLVRERVVDALGGAFPGGVKIARLDGSVFGTLTVRGVELDGRDHKPWITVGEIDVRASLTSLLHETVRVDSLIVSDVAIDQHPQPPAPPEPEPEPEEHHHHSHWSIEVAHAEIHHAGATIATGSRTLDVHDVNINLAASIERGAITALVGVHGKWADRNVAATGTVWLDDGVIASPFAAIKVGHAQARVLGLRFGDVIEGVAAGFLPAVAADAVAQLHLPGDIAVIASASEDGALDLHGAIGDATLRVVGQAQADARTASVLAIADVPNGGELDPRFAGRAQVTAALSGGLDHVRGMVAIDAARPLDKMLLGKDQVAGRVLLAVDATPANAWVLLGTGIDAGETRATSIAELARAKDGSISVTKSTLVASASKIGSAESQARVGYLAVNANASGPLWPKPSLQVTGMVDGDTLRFGSISAASVDGRFDTRHLTQANLHLDIGNVRVGDTPIASASLDARAAREQDGTIDIAVDRHSIATAANGTWSGTGGRIRIEPARIVVENLHTGNGTGTVVANATIERATSNLRATLTANGVALATLQPDLGGTLGGTLSIERRGGTWNGNGQLQGRGVVVRGQSPMDVDVALQLAGHHVQLSTTATAPEGNLTVAADVDGPYDITDAAGWKRLQRKAIHELSIDVEHFDLAKLGKPGVTGAVSGKLDVTATGASGDLALRGFVTKQGTIDADITLEPDTRGPLGLLAQFSGKLEGVDSVSGDVQLDLPARPFDPAQWQALGKRVLYHATATLAPLDFDPAVLARAHLDQPYRGHVEAKLDVSEGAGSITANVDATKVHGGVIVGLVDAHVEVDASAQGVHATASVVTGKRELVTVDASSPITIAVGSLAALRALPLTGTIAIPHVPAEQIVAVLGRRDVTNGVVDGTIELGGTIGKPAGQLALTASHVVIPASIAGRPPAKLDWFQIAGTWDGVAGELAISGRESNGGKLAVAAAGRPDQLKAFVATASATKFDLAPVTAFSVGALSAARGTLDASVSLRGLDATTGQLEGHVDIHDGRLPISPLLGTLRSTEAHVTIANHELDADISAKLGRGDLKGNAKVTLVGSTPTKATAHATLQQISLVRALQPTIDATIDATFTHDTAWRGDISVKHGKVLVATTGGVALLAADEPSDMQFTDQAPSQLLPLLQRPPPAKPWLVANVELDNTGLEVIQDEFQIRGNVGGKVELSIGDGIGMAGSLEATTQNIELLGARAQLDHASVTWDGTLDPMLDISVLREMTDLTITANVTGRLSKPAITLASDSGSYTQGELIGYFLGGTPSADRSDVSQTAAAAGAGAASALVTSQLRKVLPPGAAKYASRVSLNYEVATASSSEALRVGYWISKHVFIAVHSHLEPLPDENANEGIGEWHFRNNMMLEGNAGDRGIAGLDLVRRWRW